MPLISALCNDRSLMSFQNLHLAGHQSGIDLRRLSYCTPPTGLTRTSMGGRPVSWHVDSGSNYCDHNGLPTLQRTHHISNIPGASAANFLPPTPLTKWTSSNFGTSVSSLPQLSVPVTSVPYNSQTIPNSAGTLSNGWMPNTRPLIPSQQRGIKTFLVTSNERNPDLR